MAPDTGTIDLQQVEAERRRQAGDAFDAITVPDDPSALFDLPLSDDAAPELWARRIVDEIITLHGGGATDAPVVDDERPLEEPPAAPAALADDHRAFFALLDTDEPQVLLPGEAVDPDAPVWRPAPAQDDDLAPLVDRLLASARSGAAAYPQPDDGTALGAGAARTAAWVLLALVWAASLASLVPLLFEGIGAAVDAQFQIWP